MSEGRNPLNAPGPTSPSDVQWELALVLTFSLLSIILIIKNLGLQYPLVIGDEYYYSILSRYFGHQHHLFAHNGLLPNCPNEVYLWVYSTTRFFRDNFYQAAKVLNSLWFAAAIFPIYAISRRFLYHIPALVLTTLVIIAPIEVYTAYFMPESCYFFAFWVFVLVLISNLPDRILTAGTLGGAALGLLILIKPHALAVMVGANLTLAVIAILPTRFDIKRREAVKCFALFDGACLLTVTLVHMVMFGHRDLDIFGLYGSIARIPIPDKAVFIRHAGAVLLRHLTYITPIFGLPIVATFLAGFGSLATDRTESRARLQILSVFALMTCSSLLIMTATATAIFGQDVASELERIHGRYYDFALPLFLIPFYALPSSGSCKSIRIPFVCGVLGCLVLVLVGWKCFAGVWPISFIDYPEMAWAAQPHSTAVLIFWPATALLLMYYAIVGLKEKKTYSIFLGITLLAGSILTVSAQYSVDLETPSDQAAMLVRVLFKGAERDLGLVIGSDGFAVRRCLFGIQANPLVLELPRGTIVDRHQIGNQIHWVLSLDDLDLRVPLIPLISLTGLKISLLRPLKGGISRNGASAPRETVGSQNRPGIRSRPAAQSHRLGSFSDNPL